MFTKCTYHFLCFVQNAMMVSMVKTVLSNAQAHAQAATMSMESVILDVCPGGKGLTAENVK